MIIININQSKSSGNYDEYLLYSLIRARVTSLQDFFCYKKYMVFINIFPVLEEPRNIQLFTFFSIYSEAMFAGQSILWTSENFYEI